MDMSKLEQYLQTLDWSSHLLLNVIDEHPTYDSFLQEQVSKIPTSSQNIESKSFAWTLPQSATTPTVKAPTQKNPKSAREIAKKKARKAKEKIERTKRTNIKRARNKRAVINKVEHAAYIICPELQAKLSKVKS